MMVRITSKAIVYKQFIPKALLSVVEVNKLEVSAFGNLVIITN